MKKNIKPKKTIKKTKKTHNRDYSRVISIAIALVLSSGILLALGYYIGYSKAKKEASVLYSSEKELSQKSIDRLQYIIDKKNISSKELTKRLKNVLKDEKHDTSINASHEYTTKDSKPPKAVERKIVRSVNKPKIAIIIDDVSFSRDVKAIKALHLPLTMSFLPPSNIHPNSAHLAAKEKHYMVHLPLEATNFSAAEANTLRVGDSQKKISDRIREIKKLFPRVKYINNHTGSKFTANEMAMNKLIFALKKNNIRFIDSRTTAKTKAPIVLKNFGYPYIARDVFLDHVSDIKEIKKQLKRAIDLAKKHGTAIVIGHPHKITLRALSQSKGLLKEVDLVSIDELM